MANARRLKPGMGVRILGGIALAAAVVAYLLLDEPYDLTIAFALVILGLFALLVIADRVVSAETYEATLRGGAHSLVAAAKGLRLDGVAVQVPPHGNLQRDRLFLSAEDRTKPLPVMDDATLLYAAPANVRSGLALDPPGRALADQWESATGERFDATPVGQVQTSLAGLGASEGLYREVRLLEEKGRFSLSFRPTGARPPCFDTLPGERLACERNACALCSVACVAIARSLGRPVAVEKAEVAEGRVTLSLAPEVP